MNKKLTLLIALIPCTLWASVFPVVKLLVQELDITSDTSGKMALAGMRFFTAGVLILITSVIMNKQLPIPKKSDMVNIGIVGLFQTAGLYGLYYYSIAFVTGVKASVISQGGIFYMIILAFFFLGERISKRHIIGIFFGLTGIIVLNLNGLSDTSSLFSFTLKGEGLLLLSGVFSSIGQILAKKRCSSVPPMILNGWQMTLGGGLLLIVGTIMNDGLIEFSSAYTIVLMLYSIMVAAVAFTVWYVLLQKANVNDIVPIRLTIPVLGSIFSAIFLPGESLTLNIIFGLVFVVMGMYVITFSKIKASKRIEV